MILRFRLPDPDTLKLFGRAALAALLLGVVIPLVFMSSGVGAYPEGSAQRNVAEAALANARAYSDGLMQRAFYLRATVVEVEQVPYHCAERFDDPDVEARKHWAAAVRLHSYFGVPVGEVVSECGGAGPYGLGLMPVSRPEAHPIVGTWEVVDQSCPSVCALTTQEAIALLGKTAEYGAASAGFDDTVCGPVSYPTESKSAADFAAGFGTTPEALGIEGQVREVTVRCDGEEWGWPGGYVALLDDDHGFLMWDGVFFRLVRVDLEAEAARSASEDACDVLRVVAPTIVAFLGLPEEGENESASVDGLEELLSDFQSHLNAARPRLAAIGVRVQDVYGPCIILVGPDQEETFRPQNVAGRVGYLARGMGVRDSMVGLRDATALVAFAQRAFGL